MGKLIMLGSDPYAYKIAGGVTIYHKGYYINADAISSLIRYISRTRKNEERQQELKDFGCLGASSYEPIEFVISQFQKVQKIYDNEDGRKMYHFLFTFSDEELDTIGNNYYVVSKIAREISAIFYNMGFQVAYAVHDEVNKRIHIHLAVNAVSFTTGKKLHIDIVQICSLSKQINDFVKLFLQTVSYDNSPMTAYCYAMIGNPAFVRCNLQEAYPIL